MSSAAAAQPPPPPNNGNNENYESENNSSSNNSTTKAKKATRKKPRNPTGKKTRKKENLLKEATAKRLEKAKNRREAIRGKLNMNVEGTSKASTAARKGHITRLNNEITTLQELLNKQEGVVAAQTAAAAQAAQAAQAAVATPEEDPTMNMLTSMFEGFGVASAAQGAAQAAQSAANEATAAVAATRKRLAELKAELGQNATILHAT